MAKMKLKTLSGAKKRFKMTASGKIKRNASKRRHIQTKKTTKLTRGLACGATLTRSRSLSIAIFSASRGLIMPICAPSAPIRRISLSRICSLISSSLDLLLLAIVTHLPQVYEMTKAAAIESSRRTYEVAHLSCVIMV